MTVTITTELGTFEAETHSQATRAMRRAEKRHAAACEAARTAAMVNAYRITQSRHTNNVAAPPRGWRRMPIGHLRSVTFCGPDKKCVTDWHRVHGDYVLVNSADEVIAMRIPYDGSHIWQAVGVGDGVYFTIQIHAVESAWFELAREIEGECHG